MKKDHLWSGSIMKETAIKPTPKLDLNWENSKIIKYSEKF